MKQLETRPVGTSSEPCEASIVVRNCWAKIREGAKHLGFIAIFAVCSLLIAGGWVAWDCPPLTIALGTVLFCYWTQGYLEGVRNQQLECRAGE